MLSMAVLPARASPRLAPAITPIHAMLFIRNSSVSAGRCVRARCVMENVPNMVAMKNGHFRTRTPSAFASAGYRRTAIVPVLASSLVSHRTVGAFLSSEYGMICISTATLRPQRRCCSKSRRRTGPLLSAKRFATCRPAWQRTTASCHILAQKRARSLVLRSSCGSTVNSRCYRQSINAAGSARSTSQSPYEGHSGTPCSHLESDQAGCTGRFASEGAVERHPQPQMAKARP